MACPESLFSHTQHFLSWCVSTFRVTACPELPNWHNADPYYPQVGLMSVVLGRDGDKHGQSNTIPTTYPTFEPPHSPGLAEPWKKMSAGTLITNNSINRMAFKQKATNHQQLFKNSTLRNPSGHHGSIDPVFFWVCGTQKCAPDSPIIYNY